MKSLKKTKLCLFALISIGSIFVFIWNAYFTSYNIRNKITYKNKNLEKCNIFKENPIDTRVDFGTGGLYPKQLPLYYNNSYNFNCLNIV
jgi:hypothetical protein